MENEMTCKDLFLAFCEKAGIVPIKRVNTNLNEVLEVSPDCEAKVSIDGFGEAWFEFDGDGKLIKIVTG